MSIAKTDITRFLELAQQYPLLDVRSPGEYGHAHIPGALNLPLFTDEERKVVGTAYKQQGRETAIKIGLDYFGPKMRAMVEDVEKLTLTADNCVLVHCWRGGMRSAAVAWLLDLYGFRVYTLSGGYKRFRHDVLDRFSLLLPLRILGGYTGSGKTRVLKQLAQRGERVIDLETIASHKGSAFGDLGEKPQPTQEMFENILGMELRKQVIAGGSSPVWMEDESQRIGSVNIPNELWKQMRRAPVDFLEIPFEERLDYLVQEYGGFEKEKLLNAISRMQKRLGGLEARNAAGSLEENKVRECFRVLLRYYDKCYDKGLANREDPHPPVNLIRLEKVEPVAAISQLTLTAIGKNKTFDLSNI